MIRKLVVAMAAAGAIGANSALALGLGDITLHSALNQPLDAEIELLEVRDLEQSEMLPNLASREDFVRAGVERAFFLTNLDFKTFVRPNGRTYVKVTSKDPVREPFLNFLMEVQWPNGRMLREYTLLLDPPAYAQTHGRANTAPLLSTPAAQSRIDPVLVGDSYRVQANDTLWRIASRSRPNGNVSVQQTMLAIQELNPDAFIGGNINRLRKGAVLRLPSPGQVQQRSSGQAVSEVAEQNQSWQGQTLDARVREQANPVLSEDEGDGRLSIVTAPPKDESEEPQSGAADTSESASNAEVEALENELAISLENLDKVSRESEDLAGRLGDLEGQIATLEKLVSYKDDQLAELQRQLAEQQSATDAGLSEQEAIDTATAQPEEMAEASAEPEGLDEAVQDVSEAAVESHDDSAMAESEELADAEVDEASATQAEEIADAEDGFEPVGYAEATPESEAGSEDNVEAVAAEDASEQAASVEAITEPVTEEAVVSEPAAEVSVIEEPEQKSWLDTLLGNPLYLAGLGAGVVALALLLLRGRRKSEDDDGDEALLDSDVSDAENLEEAIATEGDDTQAESEAEESFEADLSELDELEKQLQLDSSLEETEAASEGQSPADPLKEADIYIAYGRHSQAQELLEKSIAAEPDRQDLRLKQLEVFAAIDDASAFEAAAGELEPVADLDAQMRISELRETLSSALPVGDGAETDELGDLEFDLESEFSESEEAETASEELELGDVESEDAADTNDIEFDLSEDLSPEPEVSSADDEVVDLDELDADLDFDSGLEDEEVPELSLADAQEGDDEFDLSLGEDDSESLDEAESSDATLSESDDGAADDEELLAFDADLGDDLELDAEFGLDEAVSESADESDDLDEFDLSLSDDEIDQMESDSEVEVAEADDSLEFDLDEDVEASADELSVDELSVDQGEADDESVASLDSALELDAELEEGFELDESDIAEAGLVADTDEPSFDVEESASELQASDDTLAAEALPDAVEEPSFEVDEASDVFEGDDDDDFELLSGTDEASTKLDLARAYIDMEDVEGAREILDEVLSEGTEEQQKDAQELLAKLS